MTTPIPSLSALVEDAAHDRLVAADVLAYLKRVHYERSAVGSLLVGRCRAVSPELADHLLSGEAPPAWVVRMAARDDLPEAIRERIGAWALDRLGVAPTGPGVPPAVRALEKLAAGEATWPPRLRARVVDLLVDGDPSFRHTQRLRQIFEKRSVGLSTDTIRRLLEARPDWRFLARNLTLRGDVDVPAIRAALAATRHPDVVRWAATCKVALADHGCRRRLLAIRRPAVLARLLPGVSSWRARRIVGGVLAGTPLMRVTGEGPTEELLDELERLPAEERVRIAPDVWIALLQAPWPAVRRRALTLMDAVAPEGV